MQAGDILGGRYRLVREVGQGGMGSVWLANEITLHTSVAIKILHENILNDASRERFLREAQIASQIGHPGVVSISAVGEHHGVPFMVMELLVGESLAERLETKVCLPEEKVLDLMADVLDGLSAVHRHGVIHRDLKPENIFLLEGSDATKLLDFGISVIDGPEAQRLTKTGVLIGTPLYMSPEQALGKRELDGRTDIWSLGIVMYEALTGWPPYEEGTMMQLLMAVAAGRVKSVGDEGVSVSPTTEAIVQRALRKNRDARFADAREMRAAVERARARLGGWSSSSDERTGIHLNPYVETEVGPAPVDIKATIEDSVIVGDANFHADEGEDLRTTTDRGRSGSRPAVVASPTPSPDRGPLSVPQPSDGSLSLVMRGVLMGAVALAAVTLGWVFTQAGDETPAIVPVTPATNPDPAEWVVTPIEDPSAMVGGVEAEGPESEDPPAMDETAMREVSMREVAMREVSMREVSMREVAMREVAMREVTMREVAMREVAMREVAMQETTMDPIPPTMATPMEEVAMPATMETVMGIITDLDY